MKTEILGGTKRLTSWGMFILLLIVAIATSLVALKSGACEQALMASEGIWKLQAVAPPSERAVDCPASLEMRCETNAESRRDDFFVDEITGDDHPGAQIYFYNINGPEIPSTSGGADGKEMSTFDKDKNVLISSFKDCRGPLGCWVNFKTRHQVYFADGFARFVKLWDESVDCSYQQTTPATR